MASNSEDSFHEAIKFSLEKLGKPDLEPKREQFEAIRAVCVERKDVLAVLPTGFGKCLIYQILPAIFDFLRSRGDKQEENSVVIVVSPLNALMKDQLKKLEGFLNVCVVQSVEDEEGENKVNLPQDVRKCSLLFGHPEVFVDHKNTAKMLKEKHFQESVQAIVIDEAHLVQQWSTFRPAYGKIGFLTNLFPLVPVVALTGTATSATKCSIVETLGLSNPKIVESNPNRANIYYASHARPDRGDEKLDSILEPIVAELKAYKVKMPLTLIYGSLETISDCFLYFSTKMGKDQFYPPNAEPLAKNRLFTQYHAQYPESERSRIVEELVQGTSTHRVLFVTIAFGLGIDCNDIRRVVHIGVPYSVEDYCQEVGRAGRDGLPAMADIYYNSYDISRSRKNVTDVMRNYVKSKECKRKMILNYFDHKVPSTQGPAHMCCDFHSAQCACDDCLLARAADDMDCVDTRYPDQPCDSSRDQSDNEPTPLFSEGIQAEIKKDLINYRLKLQSEVGKSSVGSVALSSGFSINLIDLVLQHLPKLASVEKVEEILPVYSSKIATDIFCIIQKHTSPQALA